VKFLCPQQIEIKSLTEVERVIFALEYGTYYMTENWSGIFEYGSVYVISQKTHLQKSELIQDLIPLYDSSMVASKLRARS